MAFCTDDLAALAIGSAKTRYSQFGDGGVLVQVKIRVLAQSLASICKLVYFARNIGSATFRTDRKTWISR